MGRKKLKFMDINEENVLTRDDMRNIMAGSGGNGGSSGRCYAYCCTAGDPSANCPYLGTCGPPTCTGTTNEECQTELVNFGFHCGSGEYVAALYKSS